MISSQPNVDVASPNSQPNTSSAPHVNESYFIHLDMSSRDRSISELNAMNIDVFKEHILYVYFYDCDYFNKIIIKNIFDSDKVLQEMMERDIMGADWIQLSEEAINFLEVPTSKKIM